jgi:hypothetical protein
VALRFIECGSEHIGRLQQFFSHAYDPHYVLAHDSALLRWQFGGICRSGERYHIKLALLGDDIVGCLGYIPTPVSVGGATVAGAWTANWIVDPSARHLSVGLRLMTDLVRQHEITLVVGASALARRILPLLGFHDFGVLSRHVRVISSGDVATLTGTSHALWAATVPAVDRPAEEVEVRRVTAFDEAVTSLWQRICGGGAGTERSRAFLDWRYTRHPVFTYRLFEAHDAGRLTGIAVYRVEAVKDSTLAVGRLVELVAEPEAAGSLLTAVCDDARDHRLAMIDYFCSSSECSSTMTANGWLLESRLPAPIPMLFQPIVQGRHTIPFFAHVHRSAVPNDLDHWYVTKGDGDQDRPN